VARRATHGPEQDARLASTPMLGVAVADGGPTFTHVFSARDIDPTSGC
jgi:hypothetical protein